MKKQKQISILVLLLSFQISAHAQNIWIGKTPLPVSALHSAKGFSIGNKGYVVTGLDQNYIGSPKLWEYDQTTDTWSAKTNFPGLTRMNAVAFSIGTKGYVGTGTQTNGSNLNDFWEWDQTTDTWTQKANFGGAARKFATGFAVNGKGYIGTGWMGMSTLLNDFWEYDPISDTWTQKTNYPAVRNGAAGFSLGNKGYICSGGLGIGNNFPNDMYEYDPSLNTWTVKAPLPSSGGAAGAGRNYAFAFTIGNNAYIGAGTYVDTSISFFPFYCQDFWEYDQSTNTWANKPDFPGGNRQWTFGFGIGTKGYAGGGEAGGNYFSDLWEYTPSTTTGISAIDNDMNILVYPNPGNGNFQLTFGNIQLPKGEIEINNALGEKVYQSEISNPTCPDCFGKSEIDLSGLPDGIYFIRLTADKFSASKKLIITKN